MRLSFPTPTTSIGILWLLFVIFSVLVVNLKKILYTVAIPAL